MFICPFMRSISYLLAAHDDQDEVFGSAYASAVYISSVMKLPKDKKVYVIGMSGVEEELEEEGVSYLGGTVSGTSHSPIIYTHRKHIVYSHRSQQTTPLSHSHSQTSL
jgi:ribonucleotide monophosphatase NagD (HAD superfamily)